MTVEWFQSMSGRRASHALIDSVWACRYAGAIARFVVSPRTSRGHVKGEVCAFCAIEVNARAVLARDEAKREARSE